MLRIALGIALSVTILSGTAEANRNHVAARGGVTDDADSVFLGIAMMAGAHGEGVRIQPAVDFGIGEFGNGFEFFSLRASANIVYAIPLSGRGRFVYPLIGPTLFYYNIEDCENCDDTSIGINVGGGIEVSGVQVELIAGIGDDIPDISLSLGITL